MNRNDQQFIAQKIRTQYVEQQVSEVDALRRLDAKVKRPAAIFAYTFGSIGAIVLGTGMSLVMTDLPSAIGWQLQQPMIPGIAIGLIGLAATIATYPCYRRILRARKKKYADRILTLSDSILR